MYISFALASTLFFAAVRACTECVHPGNFTGKLQKYTNPKSAYCGLEDTAADAIYASVSADYYNPPDESPCDAPINVTNPITNKIISAIVVGKCKTCKGNDLFLTEVGFDALSPNGRPQRGPTTVEWTFT